MGFLTDRESLNLRLPTIYLDKVSKIANDLDIPKSRVIEMILEDYLVNNPSSIDFEKMFNSLDNSKSAYSKKNMVHQPVKDALLMAGGIGSRLRPFTDEITKPMIPVHGKPLLEHQVELLRHYGVENIYFSICYKGEQIKQYFGDGKRFGMNFFYLKEDKPMGTAYALRLLKRYGIKRPFFMLNADILCDIDLKKFAKAYDANPGKGMIALYTVDDPTSFGVAKMKGNQILDFVEKPKTKRQAPSNLINAGVYLLDSDIIDMVPNKKTMMEYDIFPVLAKKNELTGYKLTSQWFDTGTPERYSDTIENWNGYSWAKK